MSEHSDPEKPDGGDVAEPHRHGDPELLFREIDTVERALKESLTRWEAVRLRGRWLVNSHPKSGTHLLRNVLSHFNRTDLYQYMVFFNTFEGAFQAREGPQLYAGHVAYRRFAATTPVEPVTPILLVRHPYAVLLALARAFYDINTERADHRRMREECTFEEIVAQVAGGYEYAGFRHSSLAESLSDLTLDWLGNTAFTVKFEELTGRLKGPDYLLVAYLAPVLEAMFGTVPDDAAARIRAGASPAISATFSRTRNPAAVRVRPADVPALLPAAEARRLREIALLLGYGKTTSAA